jgi:hypothetical protein
VSTSRQARRREFAITVKFETSRLEEQNLNAAYELVLPISERAESKRNKISGRSADAKREQGQLQIFSSVATAI